MPFSAWRKQLSLNGLDEEAVELSISTVGLATRAAAAAVAPVPQIIQYDDELAVTPGDEEGQHLGLVPAFQAAQPQPITVDDELAIAPPETDESWPGSVNVPPVQARQSLLFSLDDELSAATAPDDDDLWILLGKVRAQSMPVQLDLLDDELPVFTPTPPTPTPGGGGGSSGGSGAWISAGGAEPGRGLSTEFLLEATRQESLETEEYAVSTEPAAPSALPLLPLVLSAAGLLALAKAVTKSTTPPLAELPVVQRAPRPWLPSYEPPNECPTCGYFFTGRGSGAHQRTAHIEACRTWECAGCGELTVGTNRSLRAAGWRFEASWITKDALGMAVAVCPECRTKRPRRR
jgi:hypothetical protein